VCNLLQRLVESHTWRVARVVAYSLAGLIAVGIFVVLRSQPNSVGGTMMTRIRPSVLGHQPPRTRQFTGRIRAMSAQTGGWQTPSAGKELVAITEASSPYGKETTEQSSRVETTSTRLAQTRADAFSCCEMKQVERVLGP
jgi:hypothetical protein